MRLSRADRSLLTDWWFTVDRVLLAAIVTLIAVGVVFSLAASPAVAVKKGLPAFHFVERHVIFAVLSALTLIAVSTLTPRGVRRLALVLYLGALAALVSVLVYGDEVNGARRWLRLESVSLQPSEIAKPAFVVLVAWALAEGMRRSDMPGLIFAALFYVAFAALLVLQPDVGQTLLISAVFGVLFFLSGQPMLRTAALAGVALAGLASTYVLFPHVRQRVDRHLGTLPTDNSQLDRAIQSFTEGGFLGRGPGEGTIKSVLPDAHTDFIFAVIAEEYGVLACLALVALFAFIVLRALSRLAAEPEPFTRLAVSGLVVMFALQALINMAVNVGLIPTKGMTLPLISAGGSSMLGVSIALGMLLALTRRRADPARLKMPRLAATSDGLGSIGSPRA
jgi:cell division protein FtsW